MNALLVVAGAIVAGIIATVAITTAETTSRVPLPPSDRPKKRTRGDAPIVPFTYVKVPLYRREDKQLVEVGKRNLVKESPAELVDMASKRLGRQIVLDDFVLASVIASEAGPHYTPYMRGAIGSAVVNHQNALGESIFDILPHGSFGDQLAGSYASTARPPTEEDLLIAEAVRNGRLPDVTGGAVQFDSPRTQRNQYAKGQVRQTPEEVAADRMKERKVVFYLPNVDHDEIRFWVPKSRPRVA